MNGPVATGVRRLDELLAGGLPSGRFALVFGPPFIGKETLASQFFADGWARGEPAILVLTNRAASDVRAAMGARLGPAYGRYEEQGLVHYVDAYSRAIGADADDARVVTYVDSLMDLSALSAAVDQIQARLIRQHPTHRLVFDSVSTLAAYTNPQTTFRFLQVFLGRARRAGATGMVLLDEGMHSESDVRMYRHLVDGVIEVREDQGKHVLHVDGLGVRENHGWVEYRFGDHQIEITGSFSAGRIR